MRGINRIGISALITVCMAGRLPLAARAAMAEAAGSPSLGAACREPGKLQFRASKGASYTITVSNTGTAANHRDCDGGRSSDRLHGDRDQWWGDVDVYVWRRQLARTATPWALGRAFHPITVTGKRDGG